MNPLCARGCCGFMDSNQELQKSLNIWVANSVFFCPFQVEAQLWEMRGMVDWLEDLYWQQACLPTVLILMCEL
jgi:hypothetical protein